MIRARVAYDPAGETYRFWWNDPAGGFGWRSFVSFGDAMAAAVRFVSSRNGGGPVRVSSDGVRARIESGSGAGWDCGECLQVQPAGADYVDDPRGFRVCDSCVVRLLGGES